MLNLSIYIPCNKARSLQQFPMKPCSTEGSFLCLVKTGGKEGALSVPRTFLWSALISVSDYQFAVSLTIWTLSPPYSVTKHFHLCKNEWESLRRLIFYIPADYENRAHDMSKTRFPSAILTFLVWKGLSLFLFITTHKTSVCLQITSSKAALETLQFSNRTILLPADHGDT